MLTTRSSLFAAILALSYGIFGALWIAASDTIAAILVTDVARLTSVQIWKGWAFVLFSALLIYGIGCHLLRAIEASERRYRLLFMDSPEALALYEPDSLRVVEINAAASRLFGYHPDEVRGRDLNILMPEDTRHLLEREKPRLMDGYRSGGVWRMRCKDGRLMDLATRGHMVTIQGRMLRLVQLTDITARLRAEGELLRALQDEATTSERMRELTRALSHDVQEPLRQVSGFVQLLAKRYKDRLDDEANQFIAFAVEGIARMKTLISDVERFAQSTPFAPMGVPTDRLVADVIEDLRETIEASGAEITVGHLPCVNADSSKLAVVFHALLDNSIKFRQTGRPSRVVVDGRAVEGAILFSVRDNGMGIAPEFRDEVFSLFSRLHTRGRFPGNGTGLALARKLVEAHGGKIWIEDGEDGGITTCFTLPGNGDELPQSIVETASIH